VKNPTDQTEFEQAFRGWKTRDDVAVLLGVNRRSLAYQVFRHPKQYICFDIKKRSGGMRMISAPNPSLKEIQRSLSKYLYTVYRTRNPVHGFALGRSIATNGDVHLDKRYILKIDLTDFFDTIHIGRVIGLFEKVFHFNKDVAILLAQICCRTGSLPQGAPTSPVLSNLICWNLDNELRRVAMTHRCSYTRYADDITFSTNQARFPKDLATIAEIDGVAAVTVGAAITGVVAASGFTINESKVRLLTKTQRQEVTGVVVNVKRNVDRRFIRNIRATLFKWDKLGTKQLQKQYEGVYRRSANPSRPAEAIEKVIRGRIEHVAYIRGQRDTLYAGLAARFNKLADKKLIIPATASEAFTTRLRRAVWVIEGDAGKLPPDFEPPDAALMQGTAFYLEGTGWVTCAHCVEWDGVDWSQVKYLFRPDNPSKRYSFKISRSEPAADLAVLSADIPASEYEPLQIAKTSPTRNNLVQVVGWPEFRLGDDITVMDSRVISFTMVSGIRRMRVSAPIVGGNSGGPGLNADGRVIGVVVTGSHNGAQTINNALIPISALCYL
jgi:RNA-directed DNA polymerase